MHRIICENKMPIKENKTVQIRELDQIEFIETPCKCGCGELVRTELRKYLSTSHYAKHLSEKNQLKKKNINVQD